MSNLFAAIMAIRSSTTINRFLFYYQKLPLIGKFLPDHVFARLTLKRNLGIVAQVAQILSALLNKLLFLGVLVFLPILSMGTKLTADTRHALLLHIWVCISFLVAAVSNASILEPKRVKYICVKLMRMPATGYMRVTLAHRYVVYLLTYVLAAWLFFGLLGEPVGPFVLAAVLLTAWRIGCEVIHLFLFDRYGHILIKNNPVIWSVIGVGYACAYLPLFIDWVPATGAVLLRLPVIVVVLLFGCFGIYRLTVYRGYPRVVDAATKRDDPLLDLGKLMKDSQQADMKKMGKNLELHQGASGKHDAKKDYAYLNALFFDRFSTLLRKPIYIRLLIIAGVFVVGLAFWNQSPERATSMLSQFHRLIPLLAYVLFFLSTGERMCKAFFYHCDLSLLRYGFYREPQAINRMYRLRLLRASGYALLPAAALAVASAVLLRLANVPFDNNELILLVIAILLLSLFFTVHHVTMYYLLQPYSSELNLKNPFFSLINGLISSICFVGLFVQGSRSLSFFAISILVGTLLYLVIGLILVARIGSRTFRIR